MKEGSDFFAIEPSRLLAIDAENVLVSFESGRTLVLPRAIGMAVVAARIFAPMQEHARRALEGGRIAPEQLEAFASTLRTLVEMGVARQFPGTASERRPGERPPAGLVIVSRDRPALTGRLLHTLARHENPGPTPAVWVFDDSESPEVGEQYRMVVQAARRETNLQVTYVGRPDKEAVAKRLARLAAVSPRTVQAALLGPAGSDNRRGANTNAALLTLIGRALIFFDDDVLYAPTRLSRCDLTPRFTGESLPVPPINFPDRTVLGDRTEPANVDLLGLHQKWLGRQVQQVDAPLSAGDRIGADFFAAGDDGADPAVVATCAGFFGDSGSEFPWYVLFASDASRSAIMTSEERYRSAISERVIARCPERVLVGKSQYFQGVNVGLDNLSSTNLPPFVPFFRCSDNLFGSTLGHLYPQARVCYLPVGVWHSPDPGRRHAADEVWQSAASLRFHDFVEAILGLWSAHQGLWGAGSQGFIEFGRQLCALPLSRLHRLVFEMLASRVAFRIRELRALLSRHGRQPEYWARDAECFIAEQMQWLARGEVAFREEKLKAGLASAREHLAIYLDVLEAWPTLRAAAASVDLLAHH
jgi:hypothetical protein